MPGKACVTSIVFDDKLKRFIEKFKRDNPEILMVLECGDVNTITNIQETIRQWAWDHREELTIIPTKIHKTKTRATALSKSDNFTIHACIIHANLNGCESWDDVFGYHCNTGFSFKGQEWDPGNTHPTRCACSHAISNQNVYCIAGINSPYKMMVGCECILNHSILSMTDICKLNAAKKRRIKQKKMFDGREENEKNNYPRCVDCWKKKEPNAYRPRCISCWYSNNNQLQVPGCP